MSEHLKKIQAIENNVLVLLDKICKKHSIKYFLAQGTLLGAAKYKGFIPWDDDIDIIIPYSDLDRLYKVFDKEAPDNYLLTNHKIEKYYPLSWSKIRVTDTLSRPKKYADLKINWGICIDLFPIYPLSNHKFMRKIEIFGVKLGGKMLMSGMTKYESGHGAFVRLLEKIPICIRHFCFNTATGFLKRHKKTTDYVYIPCKGGKVVKSSLIFGREQVLAFGDGEYPVPSNYHEFLTLNYGDYMQPLPDDQKGGHDLRMGEIEWKL